MRRLKAPWLVPVHVLLHYVPFSSVSPLPPILPIVLFPSPFVYTPFNADTNDELSTESRKIIIIVAMLRLPCCVRSDYGKNGVVICSIRRGMHDG